MSIPPPPTQGNKYRILLVEDDEHIARLVLANLSKAGFDCRHASDGKAGLAAFQTTNPHLAVLDLMMPYMDGRELCTKIRENSTIPIIMMTALDQDEDQVAGFKIGADDYIPKPFNPKLLVARVVAHLRRVYRYDVEENQAKAKANNQPTAPTPPATKQLHNALPAGWGLCESCSYMGPAHAFRQERPGRGSSTVCPHCQRSEYITFNVV